MAEKYKIHQIVSSIQGEGIHLGLYTNFIRFSGCNLACSFCDTKDHVYGRDMTLDQILDALGRMPAPWVHLCGGEPTLQADQALLDGLHKMGFRVSMETNGTNPVPVAVDYLVVSPKVDPDTLKQNFGNTVVNELKYVLGAGQMPPIPIPIPAVAYLVSPIFNGNRPDPAAMRWVLDLVSNWPGLLRFSVQVHKFVGVV